MNQQHSLMLIITKTCEHYSEYQESSYLHANFGVVDGAHVLISIQHHVLSQQRQSITCKEGTSRVAKHTSLQQAPALCMKGSRFQDSTFVKQPFTHASRGRRSVERFRITFPGKKPRRTGPSARKGRWGLRRRRSVGPHHQSWGFRFSWYTLTMIDFNMKWEGMQFIHIWKKCVCDRS